MIARDGLWMIIDKHFVWNRPLSLYSARIGSSDSSLAPNFCRCFRLGNYLCSVSPSTGFLASCSREASRCLREKR